MRISIPIHANHSAAVIQRASAGRSGAQPRRTAATIAAITTASTAKSASWRPMMVDPTWTCVVGWYRAWMKSIGNAAASTSASGLTSASVSAPRRAARARHDSVPVTATRASVVRPLRRMTAPMRSRLFWRRSAAAAGIYSSAVLGFAGTVVALHLFSTHTFGLYALVLAAAGFFQRFLDVTVEEALIKFGFRYTTREDWGRLRRLFASAIAFKFAGGLLAAGAIAGLAPLAHEILHKSGLQTPLYVAALLPLAQCVENVGGVGLILRGRYDIRAFLLFTSMALRLTAIAVAAPHGLTATIAAIVAAQAVAATAGNTPGWVPEPPLPRTQAIPLGS